MASLMIRVLLLFLLWLAGAARGPAPDVGVVIAVGNGGATTSPVRQLSYCYDTQLGRLRVHLTLASRPNADAFTVRIIFDGPQWRQRSGTSPAD